MKIDYQILLDEIHGRISDHNRHLFNKWIAANDQHPIYFEKLRQRELGEELTENQLSQERQTQYRNAFLLKIKTLKNKRTNRKRQLFYAACVAVLAWAIIFGFLHNPKGQHGLNPHIALQEDMSTKDVAEETAHDEETTKVSNKKVQLITATGEKISLMDTKVGEGDNKTQPFHLSEDKTSMVYSTNNTKKEQGLNSLLVYRGAEFRIALSDGSVVHLNSDSKLEYPTSFDEKERRVYLHGEAFFEVAKDAERPFIVCMGSTEIKVLGTTFNINSRKPESIKTTLVTGSVTVKSAKIKEMKLKPGYTAILNPITGSLDINDNDIQCYIGWKTGNYLFESIRLSDILDELAIWYDLTIDYQTDQAYKETFTGSLSRKLPISKLIQIIERTNYLSLKLNKKTLTVKDREAGMPAEQ